MGLIPGSRLGAYEIVAPIGAGGMGEVYRARDTRLDRTVAIKVLPDALAADPEFRNRFDREARTISQLTHPNICTLYDVGEDRGTAFLVMEYLEGQTLAEALAKSPFPMDVALRIAIQIVAALDKAHRAGVVHRDLKPGNVVLTKSAGAGVQAKLLDFGLAKRSASVVAAGLSDAPTIEPGLTAHGAIVGTPDYMAPEQVVGEEADPRTDLFAFGVVFYQMLTGKRAFSGHTTAALLSAILKDEVPPVSASRSDGSSALDRLIRRCLGKDRNERWQTAADLLAELEWIAGGDGVVSVAHPKSRRAASRHRFLVTALLTVGVAALLVVRYLRPAPAEPRVVRFNVTTDTPFSVGPGQAVPVVSPDGTRIAFVAVRNGTNFIWVRAIDRPDAQPLAGTDGAQYPFWSADGRSLGFLGQGKVRTVDAAGGPVTAIADVPPFGGYGGGAWNADDVIIFGSLRGGLFKVSAKGGVPEPLTEVSKRRGELSHSFPRFLPDGRRFLYTATPSNAVRLASTDGGEPVRLLDGSSQAEYVDPGWLLFMRGGALMAQPFDGNRVSGQPTRVAEQILLDAGGSAAFSASGRGTLAYRTGTLSMSTQLTWFDRSGRSLGAVGQPGRYRNPTLSKEGSRIAVEVTDTQLGTQDVWLIDALRGLTTRFTFDAGNDIYPVWSGDDTSILFASDRGGHLLNLYEKRTDGTGTEQPLLESPIDMAPSSWSRDRRWVVYRTIAGGGGSNPNMGVLPLAGDRKPYLFESSPFNESFGEVSPDGRWLAYGSNESKRAEVYVQTFPKAGGGKWQISGDGGSRPDWRDDGRELFYQDGMNRLVAVPINGEGAIEAGSKSVLFPVPIPGNGALPPNGVGYKRQWDVAGDGKRVLVSVPVGASAGSPINVVLNWQSVLNK